ncbi:hypothetical protein [Rurimicrobium arvi]|uniref:Uncharacterized protein n=1 Tax=Rurimicrobium arvi TaxID=2049916 RepID=A0ABP8MQE8_9BACT
MKKSFLMAGAALMLSVSAMAQQFTDVLSKTFEAFDTTRVQEKKLEASNKLNLIAKKFDGEWLAAYYAAYGKVGLTYNESDGAKRDLWLDDADTYISQAVSVLGKDNDETYVMKAMIANARLGVDPKSRWQKYGKVFEENLDNAKQLNPDNPRIYLLRGIAKFYTPAMFGGGKKTALPYFEKAKSLFAARTDTDITKPYWGAATNNYFLGLASTEDKE